MTLMDRLVALLSRLMERQSLARHRRRSAAARDLNLRAVHGVIPAGHLDPLDPHGDGTLRPGDPAYDLLMRSMQQNRPVIVERDEDGTWREVPPHG